MAYRTTTFDGVTLPEYNATRNLGSGQVESSIVDSIGGAYNYFGSQQRLPRKHQFDVRARFLGEVVYEVDHSGNYIVDESGNFIVWGTSANHLRGQVDAVMAKRGVLGNLVRVRLDDETVEQTRECRLINIPFAQKTDDHTALAEIACVFETTQPNWRDSAASTVSTSLTAGAGKYVYAHNDGDAPLDDAIITIARTSGTISAVSLIGDGIDISWTGSIGASQSLVIDCGLQTVRIGTTDEYDGFCINAGHTVRGWFPMPPGQTGLQCTVTGGAATFTIDWYNQWV